MKALLPKPLVQFRLRSEILIAAYRTGRGLLTLDEVTKIRDERLKFQNGVDYPVMIICPRTVRFEKEAIHFLKGKEGMKGVVAAAIVLDNWALMQLARLFLQRRNIIPVKIFFNKSAAFAWLQEKHRRSDVPIDLSPFEEADELLHMKSNPHPKKAAQLLLPAKFISKEDVLTSTERKVVELILEGKTSQEIADDLFMDIRTVDKHRQHINRKSGTRNPVALLRWLIGKEKNMV